MKGLATMLWARVLTGVFLTLLVREVCAPSRVAASCGDYVTVTNPTHPSRPHSMPEDPVPPFGQAPHDLPPQGNAPCHTPSCDGGPALPAPPVSTSANPDQERWDGLLTLASCYVAASRMLPLIEHALKPRRLPPSIFHPPRAG